MRVLRNTLLIFLICLSPAWAGDWALVKYGGRDYVTLQNVGTFYGLGPVGRISNAIELGRPGRSLRGSVGSNELYINNLKFILSYPIAEVDGEPIVSRMDLTKLIEPVMRPSRIKGAEKVNTIILDPGHGGHDNGAASLWGNEKAFTLDVALRARLILMQHGFKVYLTRSTDVFVPLETRARYASHFSNALFVSIHFNSGGAGSGLETYTLAPRGVPSMMADGPRVSDLDLCRGNSRDAENMALATAMHASLVSRSQLYDRGIKRARFVVIRDITIPGVLVEGGFLSNPDDSRKIASTQYRQNMAFCISAAVLNYRNAVGTQTPSNLIAGKSVNIRDLDDKTSPAQTDENKDTNAPVVITSSPN